MKNEKKFETAGKGLPVGEFHLQAIILPEGCELVSLEFVDIGPRNIYQCTCTRNPRCICDDWRKDSDA